MVDMDLPSAPTGDSADLNLGRIVDGCRLERKLGQGGMGVVYLGINEGLNNQPFCIKILNPALVGAQDTVDRFFREAHACAQLNHPNIVAIHNVGQETDIYYIRMEYVEGLTLEELVRQNKRLDWRHAVEITLETAEALAHAHQKGMIHRDIKPENIMFTPRGEVKVMDFGLAKHVHASNKVSVTGQIVGTPFFMSPEQAGGKPTDARSDIYSLGVTLYYLLTGEKPFNGKNLQEIFLKHFFYSPESPKIYVPELPEPLCEIVKKCLKKKKKERYQSSKALARDLKAVLDDPSASLGQDPSDAGSYDPSESTEDFDRTVRVGGGDAPAPEEGDHTVRVGGGQAEAGLDEATLRVGGAQSGGEDAGEATVAVKGQPQAPARPTGRRGGEVATISFKSASAIMNPGALQAQDEDDPTAGLDLPQLPTPGKTPPKPAPPAVVAGGSSRKGMALAGVLVLVPVLLYAGNEVMSRARYQALEQRYQSVKDGDDPAAIAAVAEQLDKFAKRWSSRRADAVRLAEVCRQRASALVTQRDADSLAARQREEELKRREAELARQQRLREEAELRLKELEDAKQRRDWRKVAELGLAFHDAYAQELPEAVAQVKIPVPVTSDPGSAEVYLDEAGAPVATTPGVVWVVPFQTFTLRFTLPGFEPESRRSDSSQFRSFDVEFSRKVRRTLALGTTRVRLGTTDRDEPLLPMQPLQLDESRGGLAYFVGQDGLLYGLSLQRGSYEWTPAPEHRIGLYGDPTPALRVVPGHVILAGSLSGVVSAHDPNNGGVRVWSREVGAPVTSQPGHSKAQGAVAVGTAQGSVVFLSDGEGRELWRFETENAVVTAPLFVGDERLVCVGSTDNRVYCVDWQAQKVLGHLDLGSDVVVGPVTLGGRLLCGTADGSVHVVSVGLGGADRGRLRLLASAKGAANSSPVAGLAVEEGTRIYASIGRELRAWELKSGPKDTLALAPLWSEPFQGTDVLTAPLAQGGAVYVCAANGTIYALKAASGEVLWRHKTEQQQPGSTQPPLVLDSETYLPGGSNLVVLRAE